MLKTNENTYRNSNGSGLLRARCKRCMSDEEKVRNGGRRDALHLWYTFGLTESDYTRMLEEQGGVCAICGGPEPNDSRFSVDHDHMCCPGRKSCGRCVRGLLCRQCNTGIGNLGESPDTLRAALEYLEEHMLKVVCPDDGYIVRTTQKWLDIGMPFCPCGEQMEYEAPKEDV